MTLLRTRGVPYATGEEISFADLNSIDSQIEGALDKRAGQTDTLASLVSLGLGGRIVKLSQAGLNADSSYEIGNGEVIVITAASLTANRQYTLSTTGAIEGDLFEVWVDQMTSIYTVTVRNSGGSALARLGSYDSQRVTFRFDGTDWLMYDGVAFGLVAFEFTANGTWSPPFGVFSALLVGCGAGGGGGGGKPNSTAANRYVSGGGGGGGALHQTARVAVSASNTYDVVVGAGGVGGGPTAHGSDGGDTRLELSGTALAVFSGAAGGRCQQTTFGTVGTTTWMRANGGAAVRGSQVVGWGFSADDISFDATPAGLTSFGVFLPPDTGGSGNGLGNGVPGNRNPFGGFNGGTGGTKGTDSGSLIGGGAGGGGAAGPYGAGGNGGNGGNGGTPGNGTAGASAGANTGAGGGGGGSGGSHGTASGTGQAGGNGGSGRLFVVVSR